MPDFPVAHSVNNLIISSASTQSLGHALSAMGVIAGTIAWPTANKAIFVPVTIYDAVTIVKMYVINGNPVSGNIDVGIYDVGGARLVSAGSTAQAGTDVVQEFNITDTTLNPGLYYLACALDNGTGRVSRWNPSAALGRALGVAEQTTAFALPSSATFAALSSSYIPAIFATPRTVI